MKNNLMTKAERDTAIRRLRNRGLKYVEISERLGISHGTVSNVLNSTINDFTYKSLKDRNVKIKALAKKGFSRDYISSAFDLDKTTISHIVNGTATYSKTPKKKTNKTKKTKTTRMKKTKNQQTTTISLLWGLFKLTRTK